VNLYRLLLSGDGLKGGGSDKEKRGLHFELKVDWKGAEEIVLELIWWCYDGK